jgi:hypothetical protein
MRVISSKQRERLEWKDKMAGIITSLAILAFVVLEVFLGILLWSTNASMTELEWGRFIYLLTGVETITFAGIGWLFGKEVHREQAQRAERQAEDAMQHATEAMKQNADIMHGAMEQVTEAMKQNVDIMHGAMEQVAETRKETMEIVHQTMDVLTQPTSQMANFHSFIHTSTSENTHYNFTDIDSPYTNNKPNAIVVVTPNWNPGGVGGTYDEYPIGVWYHSGKWSIYNQDKNQDAKEKKPMPIGAAFNVLVLDG